MAVDFSPERWGKIKEDARKWWAGELERPLIQITLSGKDPGKPQPSLPSYEFASFYDLSVPAEEIVKRWDYDLSCKKYMGDAFPCIWPNFGAGVMSAFMGAVLENANDTVWFHPEKMQEITEVSFAYKPDNAWLRRVKDVYKAAMEHWAGLVQVGMADLGGNLDILSVFRPSEKLLLDLYDQPDAVKSLTWQAHELWFKYFGEFNKILQPENPGYTAWAPIFSEEPYYMLQCDFCYMISPEMFDEFVKPELAAACKRLKNPFYHLDGPGQLPHLDSLLEIKELKGIQWIPGAGVPPTTEWPDVYRKIREAGKLIQIYPEPEPIGLKTLDFVAEQLGSASGLILIGNADIMQEKEVEHLLSGYDALQ